MCKIAVAPLVGAWIEMFAALVVSIIAIVAPLVGAWIEILAYGATSSYTIVAPLVGAWIEITFSIPQNLFPCMSLPLWERGLKLSVSPPKKYLRLSLPLWERGLK